ncbi:hypothetical protein M514_05456 [Trichuris suis]|uniref:Uncharacterized protein n=1 Tax=Trichuris suis TaxID=68888 RepID=A0A085NSM4_9BILA|nr:hypothetical protein M513_05456 [Trichuris suis]KFD72470.1 hypothetical protein M514_05456 [Trichuris suis]
MSEELMATLILFQLFTGNGCGAGKESDLLSVRKLRLYFDPQLRMTTSVPKRQVTLSNNILQYLELGPIYIFIQGLPPLRERKFFSTPQPTVWSAVSPL